MINPAPDVGKRIRSGGSWLMGVLSASLTAGWRANSINTRKCGGFRLVGRYVDKSQPTCVSRWWSDKGRSKKWWWQERLLYYRWQSRSKTARLLINMLVVKRTATQRPRLSLDYRMDHLMAPLGALFGSPDETRWPHESSMHPPWHWCTRPVFMTKRAPTVSKDLDLRRALKTLCRIQIWPCRRVLKIRSGSAIVEEQSAFPKNRREAPRKRKKIAEFRQRYRRRAVRVSQKPKRRPTKEKENSCVPTTLSSKSTTRFAKIEQKPHKRERERE